MPWCPVCKCEYREGITNCYDCRVPLVDSLDDINDPDDAAEENAGAQMYDGLEYEGFENEADPSFEDESYSPKDFENDINEAQASISNTFVKKADQYQEYLFSAYTCMLVGFAGIIFGILNIAGVFSIVSAEFTQYILLGVFILFFIGGIAMYSKSRTIKAQIGIENKKIDSVNEWLSENIDKSTLKSIKDPEVSDEINYFNYCEKVKEQLLFSIPDVDPAMADSLVDEYINRLLD